VDVLANGRFSIHNLGMVGHIEDIAVAKDQQGKKLGLRIIQALDGVAEAVGCYKVSSSSKNFFCLQRGVTKTQIANHTDDADYPRLFRS
jgi:GNAT superfamily N-acetyltransferase